MEEGGGGGGGGENRRILPFYPATLTGR